MLLVIDNYDSFTYNLVQYFKELGQEVAVWRNDAISCDEVLALKPKALVLSPGPGTPQQAGVCIPLVKRSVGKLPILGVCLGYQSIAEALGGKIDLAKVPMHGKTDVIKHDNNGVFSNLPSLFTAVRYHSIIVSHIPPDFVVNAKAVSDNAVMAMYNPELCIHGLQFHPESFATEYGKVMLQRFLSLSEQYWKSNASI